ncbi:MAG: fimbrial protein, partial [Acinetobacter sp.]
MQNRARYMAAATLLCCLNIHQITHAQNSNVELGRVNIELSGIVTTATCGVLSSEQDKYIQLG